jgi:hypothetical protein
VQSTHRWTVPDGCTPPVPALAAGPTCVSERRFRYRLVQACPAQCIHQGAALDARWVPQACDCKGTEGGSDGGAT